MNKKDKTLAFDKLMGFKQREDGKPILEPYSSSPMGLANFAQIILEFSGVFNNISSLQFAGEMDEEFKFTQEAILDEILRMNGIEA